MSIRSRTPDFHRSSLSPATTPGSPLSPTLRCTPIDHSPLSMTPIEPLNAAKVASAMAKLASKPAHSTLSSNSSGVLDKDTSRADDHREARITDGTTTKPQGNAISKDDESSNPDKSSEDQETFSPKLIKINVLTSERSLLGRKPAPIPPTTPHHPAVISPKPISPIAQRSSIIAAPEIAKAPMAISSPPTPQGEEKSRKEGKDEIINSAEATLSMESVVLSTQISETSNSSTTTRSPEPDDSSRSMSPVVALEETKPIVTPAPTEVSTATTTKVKPERPVLHPLDVKVSAKIVATNMSAHSRKCKSSGQ